MLSGLATSARANDLELRGDPVAALSSYIQVVAAAQPDAAAAANAGPIPTQASTSVAGSATGDDAYAALRAFAQRIAADPPQSTKDRVKVAEADNAFDALQQWLQGGSNQSATPAPAPAPKAAKPRPLAPVVPATIVGSKVCLGCHSNQDAAFSFTLMGRLQKQGKIECETCHGPGSAHVKAGGGVGVGGIISFRPDDDSRTVEQNNQICLGCHDRGQRIFWPGSVHEERGLACTNCHTIMTAVSRRFQLKTAFQPDTCFQCHKDRRAQMFESSHMPMREGKEDIVCSDCHNPHGSVTEALLNKDSINDVCYTCHAEKRGPFLFEHEPVRENCLNCHDPHGSVNQYSLKVARPRLCDECHSMMDATSGVANPHSVGQSCENCHVNIHGSNSPQGALFFR